MGREKESCVDEQEKEDELVEGRKDEGTNRVSGSSTVRESLARRANSISSSMDHSGLMAMEDSLVRVFCRSDSRRKVSLDEGKKLKRELEISLSNAPGSSCSILLFLHLAVLHPSELHHAGHLERFLQLQLRSSVQRWLLLCSLLRKLLLDLLEKVQLLPWA